MTRKLIVIPSGCNRMPIQFPGNFKVNHLPSDGNSIFSLGVMPGTEYSCAKTGLISLRGVHSWTTTGIAWE